MTYKDKKSSITDIFSPAVLALASAYLVMFALFIFPSLALAEINNGTQESFAGALGLALGSAIAVSLAAAILLIIGAAFIILSIVSLVLLIKSRKYQMRGDKKKTYITMQTIAGVLILVATVIIIILSFDLYLSFLPSPILAFLSLACFIAGIFLKKSEREKILCEIASVSEDITEKTTKENNSDK